MHKTAISIRNVSKVYDNGFRALTDINLDINAGEIFALLGPNGAGKTTLIGIVCGIVNPSQGSMRVFDFDTQASYREARSKIGLVPQEITTNAFETVWRTVSFTRGLFGLAPDATYIEGLLRDLSLWDKKDEQLVNLSGGMKRRVMIAKALSHEPQVLFLDEPTAGVDVELRFSMWKMVKGLRERGVTIILTTHYIAEAEEMADRVGIMTSGKLALVEEKSILMKDLGKKELVIRLTKPIQDLPSPLSRFKIKLSESGQTLTYSFDTKGGDSQIAQLLSELGKHNIQYSDLQSKQSSLEDIFVDLVNR